MNSFSAGYWSQQLSFHDDVPDSNKCQANIFRLFGELFFSDFSGSSKNMSGYFRLIFILENESKFLKIDPCEKLDRG